MTIKTNPIKETPILRGKDARKFVEKIARNEREPAPREEYERVMANYRKIKAGDSRRGGAGKASP